MRRLIITLALISCTISANAQAPDAVNHVENKARFANPERGFYLYENLLNLSREIGRRRAEGHTLIWGKIPLDAYREQTPLPQAVLDSLTRSFATARSSGMKIIVRASYGSRGAGGDYTSYKDPGQDIIEKHIAQLAPIFSQNVDVVALFEAGFVGT